MPVIKRKGGAIITLNRTSSTNIDVKKKSPVGSKRLALQNTAKGAKPVKPVKSAKTIKARPTSAGQPSTDQSIDVAPEQSPPTGYSLMMAQSDADQLCRVDELGLRIASEVYA